LTVEEVLGIHDDQLSADFGGGSTGVLSLDLLYSAVAAPEATFDGELLHPTRWDQAAAYAYHLARNHPFVDANKRTGLNAALTFLRLNGYAIHEDANAELEEMMVKIVENQLGKDAVASLLRSFAEELAEPGRKLWKKPTSGNPAGTKNSRCSIWVNCSFSSYTRPIRVSNAIRIAPTDLSTSFTATPARRIIQPSATTVKSRSLFLMKFERRTLVTSSGAHVRLKRAAEWLAARGTSERVLVIGASLDAASELLREVAARVPAAFGWERLTLGRLAALCAAPALRERELSPLSPLGVEAVCARIVHELGQRGRLGRYQPLSRQPGLARAVSRTLQELGLAGARPKGDLGSLLAAYEAELSRARLADRAEVFRLAIQGEPSPLLALPALLVDVPLHSELEARLVARLSGDVLATAPEGDQPSLDRLSRALGSAASDDLPSLELFPQARGIAPESLDPAPRSSLTRVQNHLFAEEVLPPAATDDTVAILSAPGESRECVEIARLVQREARNGVPFDRVAVLLRAPGPYRALLEEAFSRAGIPAHFAQGTVRPDPAGRAFLALLACAADGLSVRRFTEYLSLGELPEAVGGAPPKPLPRGDRWVPPDIELSPAPEAPDEEPPEPRAPSDVNAPVVAGSLRAPWRWEKLLLEAAVIGERSRWERRLSGLERELRLQAEALADDEARLERTRRGAALDRPYLPSWLAGPLSPSNTHQRRTALESLGFLAAPCDQKALPSNKLRDQNPGSPGWCRAER